MQLNSEREERRRAKDIGKLEEECILDSLDPELLDT